MLTAFGSAYYHWTPDDATLVWDRLPMTLVFMALVSIVINRRFLFPLLAFGIASIIWWIATGDLRLAAAATYAIRRWSLRECETA